MPPVIIWALGAIGAAALARFLVKEGRRVNAELRDLEDSPVNAEPEPRGSLRRDPGSGVYRPQ